MLFFTLYSFIVYTMPNKDESDRVSDKEEEQTTKECQPSLLFFTISEISLKEPQKNEKPTSSTPSENSKQPNSKDGVSSSSKESLNGDDSKEKTISFAVLRLPRNPKEKSAKETSQEESTSKNESEGEQVAGKSNQTESASKDNPLFKEKPSTERRGADLGHLFFSDEQSEKGDSSSSEEINELIRYLLRKKILGEFEGKDSKKEDSSSSTEKEMFNELQRDLFKYELSQCLKKLKKNECLRNSEREQEKGPEKDNKNVSFKEEEN